MAASRFKPKSQPSVCIPLFSEQKIERKIERKIDEKTAPRNDLTVSVFSANGGYDYVKKVCWKKKSKKKHRHKRVHKKRKASKTPKITEFFKKVWKSGEMEKSEELDQKEEKQDDDLHNDEMRVKVKGTKPKSRTKAQIKREERRRQKLGEKWESKTLDYWLKSADGSKHIRICSRRHLKA